MGGTLSAFCGGVHSRHAWLTLALMIALPSVASDDDFADPRPWPSQLYVSFRSTLNDGVRALATAIFDALDELDVFTVSFAKMGNFNVGYRVEREVFDNYDVFGTWSVVDRARIRQEGGLPSDWSILSKEVLRTFTGGLSIGLVAGERTDFEWTNVRQVESRKYRTSEAYRARFGSRREMEEALRRDLLAVPTMKGLNPRDPQPLRLDPDPTVSELNPYLSPYLFDPSTRPRFARIFNPFTFPLRLPLSLGDFRNMSDGEVISYAFKGRVETGLNANLNVFATDEVMRAGFNYQFTYILDSTPFKISVLRESARFAQVKLTQNVYGGFESHLEIGGRRFKAFKGIMLFRGSSIEKGEVGATNLDFIPFEWKIENTNGTLFDVVYRYDLEDPRAQDAYHKAVLGSFVRSAEVATQTDDTPDPAVTRVLLRTGKAGKRIGEKKVKISFFLARTVRRDRATLAAEVELPDGLHHVFRGITERSIDQRGWFSTRREKASRKFTVAVDAELYAKNDPSSLVVIAESLYEDSNTHADEMREVSREIETLSGDPALFPDFPWRVPDPDHAGKTRRAFYGRASFYYGFNLDRPAVETLLATPRAKMQTLVRKIFGAANPFHILDRFDAAVRAQKTGDVAEIYAALNALFNRVVPQDKLMYLIRGALAERPLDYFVNAQNLTFGRIQKRGKRSTTVDQIFILTDNDLGFEGYAKRLQEDPDAIVSELSVSRRPDGLLDLHFRLNQEPEMLIFRLSQLSKTNDFIKWNVDGKFKAGPNSLTLDPKSSDVLTRSVAERLKRVRTYKLVIGFSRKGKKFGRVSDVTFQAPEGYEKAVTEAELRERARIDRQLRRALRRAETRKRIESME